MTVQVEGYTDPEFLRVKDVFIRNFAEEGEVGAALAIYLDKHKVVDLWGGFVDVDRQRPWEEDTICGFYSTGKPLAAILLMRELAVHKISLDSPVAGVWPEFGTNGKAGISFRQLLCHQAGLCAVRERLPEGAMMDWELMVTHLAAQVPWFEPGTRHVYHTNTYGFLVGEPLRRLSGQTPGDYLRSQVTGPLQEEIYFGVADHALERCATLYWEGGGLAPDTALLDLPMNDEERMLKHALFNPSGLSSLGVLNTVEWRRAEVPSTNGHGTARGVAHLYGILATGGREGSYQLLQESMLAEATSLQSGGYCPALERQVDFGLGFQLTRPDRPLGPNPNAYGHFGTGGSLGFADPDIGMGFGYVMNHIKPKWQNPRNRALIDALYECL